MVLVEIPYWEANSTTFCPALTFYNTSSFISFGTDLNIRTNSTSQDTECVHRISGTYQATQTPSPTSTETVDPSVFKIYLPLIIQSDDLGNIGALEIFKAPCFCGQLS